MDEIQYGSCRFIISGESISNLFDTKYITSNSNNSDVYSVDTQLEYFLGTILAEVSFGGGGVLRPSSQIHIEFKYTPKLSPVSRSMN
jgi:hypothetical protein